MRTLIKDSLLKVGADSLVANAVPENRLTRTSDLVMVFIMIYVH